MRHWFIFHNKHLLVERLANGEVQIPYASEPPVQYANAAAVRTVTAPWQEKVMAFEAEDCASERQRYEFLPLRQCFFLLEKRMYLLAGKCEELLFWDKNTRYCSTCGAKMQEGSEISKLCPDCHKEVFPSLATAIICLIHRQDEVLLVHANNFKSDFYGLVAGFVETGESLEEAVRREISEETGLTVGRLTYFSSQPWPYPCGLMVGFFAEYQCGELRLQRSELSKGGWFKRGNLPTLPDEASIARQMIDHWAQNGGQKSTK